MLSLLPSFSPTVPLLVSPKRCPDLDGVSCAVAYAELLRHEGLQAAPYIPEPPDAEACYVLNRLEHRLPTQFPMLNRCRFVLVDASDLAGMPAEVTRERVQEVIDHRMDPGVEDRFPHARITLEAVGAAATLIAERGRELALPMTELSRILLTCGIHSNTQGLRGAVTTARDIAAVKWLTRGVVLPAGILEGQFMARSESVLRDVISAVRVETKHLTLGLEPYAFSQLELWETGRLLGPQRPELEKALAAMGPRALLNLVDVSSSESILFAEDETFRLRVAAMLGVSMPGGTVKYKPARLRKQIVWQLSGNPLLKFG